MTRSTMVPAGIVEMVLVVMVEMPFPFPFPLPRMTEEQHRG